MKYTFKAKLNLIAILVGSSFILAACGGGNHGGSVEYIPTKALTEEEKNVEIIKKAIPELKPLPEKAVENANSPKPEAGFLGTTGTGEEKSVAVDSGKDLNDPLTPTAYVEYTIIKGPDRELSASGSKKIKESSKKRLGLREVLVKDGKVTGVIIGNYSTAWVKHPALRAKTIDKVGVNAGVYTTEVGGINDNGKTKVITNVAPTGEASLSGKDDGRTQYWVIDPVTAGWNYQTYAGFENSQDTLSASGGFQSFGTLSPDVPTQGYAIYKGKSSARISTYDDSGVVAGARLTSDVTIVANFENRALSFETANTKGVVDGKYTNVGFAQYDLSGKAGWDAGSNKFIGEVTSKDPNATTKFSGDINGRFYGGKAAEVGGTYGLVSEDKKAAITGGFGAKRP